MPEEYEKYTRMAEWIVAHTDRILPEYVGERLAEATADIDTWLKGEEKTAAIWKRGDARIWLKETAEGLGYSGAGEYMEKHEEGLTREKLSEYARILRFNGPAVAQAIYEQGRITYDEKENFSLATNMIVSQWYTEHGVIEGG
jgi:hypothetical protein